MILPELSFVPGEFRKGELFFGPNEELARVLRQGNPVYVDLVLPGGNRPRVRICFPEVGTTLVYANGVVDEQYRVNSYSASGSSLPGTPVGYRYGMELQPWLFFAWLPRDLALSQYDQDNIANYSILNCSSGHGGVLIRIVRGSNRARIREEWMEIYSFEMGNGTEFAAKWRTHHNTRLLCRFTPRTSGTNFQWIPETPT